MIVEKQDGALPIRLWATDADEKTLEQLRHLARLPFAVEAIGAMPDAHVGYGMPIGGVLATWGAVVPNAVGVDIGCVDAETEFLSPDGWKRIADYDGEPVMEYQPEDGTGRWVRPQAFIKLPCESFLWFRTKYGVNQMVSEEHRMLVWRTSGRTRQRVRMVMRADELAAEHERLVLGAKVAFRSSFTPVVYGSVPLTDQQIAVQVMVNADAHLVIRKRAALHLRKRRKIERARMLLNAADISFVEKPQANGDVEIRFDAPLASKSYGAFWPASLRQLGIIAGEALNWDGNTHERCFYTRSKESADFMQYAFASCGHRAVVRADTDRSDGKIDFRVFQCPDFAGLAGSPKTPVRRVPSADGYKYCFTVPSGFWVMRRGGNIAVTGNCGMRACRTDVRAEEMTREKLTAAMGAIRKLVPVGFAHHQQRQPLEWTPGGPAGEREASKAETQVGTLGGGNHFIELQAGDDGYVWVMLHSGSRNVGKQVADHYNRMARDLNARWHVSVPDEWELAFLPLDDLSGDLYVREMTACVRFAELNREAMLRSVVTALVDQWNITGEGLVGGSLDVAHNYAALEHHHGKNVWVHRKGATRARAGERGIIPGSQGSKSFLVAGKGSPLSFESCSHGAGRKMGRKEAEQSLNLADEQQKLDAMGVVHSVRGKADLDEAPGAYKSIDEVMANQTDLVDVVVTLRPLAVVKG